MKKYFLAVIICFSNIVNAQILEFENNPNWDKYQSVKVLSPTQKNNSFSYIYDLKEGVIENMKSYFGNELRAEYEFSFDDKLNLEKLIIKSDKDEVVVNYELKYDDLGLRIENNETQFVYNNDKKISQSFSKSYTESNGNEGWIEKYFYDNLGNLIRQEKTTVRKGQPQIDIEDYIYDDCNNAIQINRSSTPKKKYPIAIIGGELKNEIDFYEYEYNSDCIWTKKYKKVEGKMKLVSVRELTEI